MHRRFAFTALATALAGAIPAFAEPGDLAAVVVTATRQQQRAEELLSDVSVIDRDEIDRAGQSTIGEFLARQPGITYTANGSPGATSSLFIRGNSPAQTLVLIDGQRIGSATQGSSTLGSVSWSRIPLSQIERIEILRGPASSLYGSDAGGGVVQIFTRRSEGAPRLTAEAGIGSYGLQAGSAGISGSQDALRYSLSVSSQHTDGFNSIWNPRNSSYNSDRDGFRNDSAIASMSFEPSKGTEVGANLFNSTGKNRYDSGSSAATAARDYKTKLAVQSAGTYVRSGLTDRWTSTLRLGKSTDDSTNYTNGAMSSVFRTDQSQVSWQNDVRMPIGDLLLAAEKLDQQISGTSSYTVMQRSIRSMLGGWTGRLGDHRLQANVRRDDNSQFGARNTGSVGYGYQLNNDWRAIASIGTAFRAPTFNDLYFPLTGTLQGNPNLKPETTRNREVAIRYDQGLQHGSATIYSNKVSDLISWSGVNSPVNIGSATLSGLTLSYDGNIAGYDVSANTDYLLARDTATGNILARRARRHGNFSIGRAIGPWEVRAEAQAFGMRFENDQNTRELGGYTIANLQGSYAISTELSAFARVNNLFNKRYELIADYATAGTNVFVGLRYTQK